MGEAVRDAKGKIIRLQGASQDISERRNAEESLRESEAQLRTLAESMPQMMWVTRPAGWNTYRLLLPDGRIKFIEERWRIVRDEQGQPQRATGTCQDITERHQAQEEILKQAYMLDRIGQAVIATDAAGHITYANRFAGEMYGWGPGEMLGRLVTEVTVPRTTRAQGDEIMAHFTGGLGADDKVAATDANLTFFLAKPYPAETLLTAIKGALSGSRQASNGDRQLRRQA